MIKRALIVSIVILCLPVSLYGLDITLEWDKNQEADRAGYKVYYKAGASGNRILGNYDGASTVAGYNSPVNVPLTHEKIDGKVEFTVLGLDNDKTYYFVVAAYDNEVPPLYSEASNEVAGPLKISTPAGGFLVHSGNFKALTLSGIAPALASVEVYSGATLLATASADAQGAWSAQIDFSSVTAGVVTLTAQSGGASSDPVSGMARGDVNADNTIDSGDAIRVLRYSVALDVLTEGEKWAGNVTDKSNDDEIDSGDAIKILRYSVGLINDF